MNTRTKMPTYHVKCYETVNFTVAIEAESEDEARELAHADINSHEVIAESTTDWDMEGVDFDKLFDVHRTLIESRLYEQIYQGA